jgi:hypothetical protein
LKFQWAVMDVAFAFITNKLVTNKMIFFMC